MNGLLRRSVERLPAPLPVVVQDTFRFLRYPQVRRRRRVHRRILGRLGTPDVVSQGPFRGMRYISSSFHSEFLPKLVGTYEREVYPAIETICAAGCDRIVDIGAAEGYYVVGLALRNPDAQVVGFEMTPSGRFYLRRLASRNGVSARVQIRGICTLESLAQSLAGARRPAVICDCEGTEDVLLRPDHVEPLTRSHILVETHDGLETAAGPLSGITDRLRDRFAPTHTIEVIASRDRTLADLGHDCILAPEDADEAMNEGRPWAQWMFLVPKRQPATSSS